VSYVGTLKLQSNGPLYSNTVICTLAVDGWAVTFWYSEEGTGRAAADVCMIAPEIVILLSPLVISPSIVKIDR